MELLLIKYSSPVRLEARTSSGYRKHCRHCARRFNQARPATLSLTQDFSRQKVAESTPLSALYAAQLVAKVFPPGVVNVVTGSVSLR